MKLGKISNKKIPRKKWKIVIKIYRDVFIFIIYKKQHKMNIFENTSILWKKHLKCWLETFVEKNYKLFSWKFYDWNYGGGNDGNWILI